MKKLFAILLLIYFVLKNLLVFSLDNVKENYLYYFDADGNGKIDNIQIDFNKELTGSLNLEKIFFYSNTGGLSVQKIDRISGSDLIENVYLSGNILGMKIFEQDNYLTGLTINNGTSSHLRIRTNNGVGITDLDGNEIVFSFTTSFNSYKNTKYGFVFDNFSNGNLGNSSDNAGTSNEQNNQQNSGSGSSQNEQSNSEESDDEIIEEEPDNQENENLENGNNLQDENEVGDDIENNAQNGTGGIVEENEIEDDIENNLQDGSGEIVEENKNTNIFPYKISLLFQSPSYLLEKVDEEKNYNCDTSKTECKSNFNLNIDQGDGFKTIGTNYICEWDFGLGEKTGEESKCNPNTITYPVGDFETTFKVYEKSNTGVYLQDKIFIKNKGYKKEEITKVTYISTYSTPSYVENINIETPKIIVQSGLDKNNNCKKNDCNLNLIYEPKNSKEECLWSFPGGSFSDGNVNNCNPSYVKYGFGDFKVTLKVYQKGNELNYKESYFYFSNKETEKQIIENEIKETDNLAQISVKSIIDLQGSLGKNKALSGNVLTCFGETCNVNFDGSQSEGKYISYLWDLGDGETFSGKNPPSKTYEKGNYQISLKVYNENGEENISYFFVNIFDNEKEFIKTSLEKDEKVDISNYKLKISKVFPNPVGVDNFEFIEVKNISDENINLLGCSLDNEVGKGSKEFLIKENVILKPFETRKFYKFETKINIRNSSYEEINLSCFDYLTDKKFWDFSAPEGFIIDENITLENIKEIKKDKENGSFNIVYKDDKNENIKQNEKLNIFENILKNDLSKEEKIEKITNIINETFTQKISKQKSGVKISGISVPNETLVLKIEESDDLSFFNLFFPKTYAENDVFNVKTDNFGVYEFLIDKPNIGEFEIKNYLKVGENLLEIEKNNILEVDDDYLDYIKPVQKEKKDETFIVPKSIITLQGVLGKSKKVVGNKITCEGVSECNINFDGRQSLGKKLSYFWDFGNGQTFQKSNPASYKFKTGEFMISLEVKSGDYKDISYFFVEVLPEKNDNDVGKESKNIFIPKANASLNDNVVNISIKKHILYSSLVFILFIVLGVIILRKKGIV